MIVWNSPPNDFKQIFIQGVLLCDGVAYISMEGTIHSVVVDFSTEFPYDIRCWCIQLKIDVKIRYLK